MSRNHARRDTSMRPPNFPRHRYKQRSKVPPVKLLADPSPSLLAGEQVIDAELSRTRANQPDKEEHVQDFRKVEEIIESAKRRKSFRHSGNRSGRRGDNHIDQSDPPLTPAVQLRHRENSTSAPNRGPGEGHLQTPSAVAALSQFNSAAKRLSCIE